MQQHGAQGAWGRGTAPKGISGAGVAKKAAMSVCKYSPGRGTQPSASTSLFSSSTSYAFALGIDQFRIPSGGTDWFRAHGRWVVRGIAVKTQEGREWEEGGPGQKYFDFKGAEAEPQGTFPVEMALRPMAPLQEPSAGPAS